MQVSDFTSYREKVSKQMKFPNQKRRKKHACFKIKIFSPRDLRAARLGEPSLILKKKISPGASIPNDAGPLNFSSARYLGVDCYMQREEIRRHL